MDFDFYKGKKVLVTGSTGFKGSWLCLWLHALGAEVYGYALKPSEQDNFHLCHLDEHIHQKYADVRDREQMLSYFKEVQPDIAFHLAAQAVVLDSYIDPFHNFEVNLMGTVNFLDAVRFTPSVKAAVNITSDKCYQNNEWLWGYRENDPMGGKDPYSASKGCAELITSAYLASFFKTSSASFDYPLTECALASARAGNVIGGGDWAPHRIVPDFFRAYKKSESLVVRNPYAVRPWQYILDLLDGYMLLAYKLYQEGQKFNGGWNFGSKEENHHTVGSLIEELIRQWGKGSYCTPDLGEKPHEANLLKLDISKAMLQLEWKPKLCFEETIAYTLQGYVDELDGGNLMQKRMRQVDEFMKM